MFMFYIKILSIIFCLFLGNTKAAMLNNCTTTPDKNSHAKVELAIKAMQLQGYSDEEILERLQKIGNKSNKKKHIYLIAGTVVVGISAAAVIYFLIKKVLEQKGLIKKLESNDKQEHFTKLNQTNLQLTTERDQARSTLEAQTRIFTALGRNCDSVLIIDPQGQIMQNIKLLFSRAAALPEKFKNDPEIQALLKTLPAKFEETISK